MQYEGTTYRPPPEGDSPLLQVTVGCAHNCCRFCHMYRDVKFRKIPMDRIEADIEQIRDIYPRAERIFLVNGDAFVLRAARLKEIAATISSTIPECKTITMYASIRNIASKSDKDLEELRALGINDLYIGIESGWDTVLTHINKGHTAIEAKRQIERLNRAGIHHIANLMLGVAGRGNGLENARYTADFLNQTGPNLIWVGTLSIFKGTELYTERAQGSFDQATELEILEEEKALIKSIELEDVTFYGVHPTNTVPISGKLPRDKRQMIAKIDHGINHYGESALSIPFERTSL